jgi:hypothetical protein
MSRNHSPKLDINQGRKISKLIIDLDQEIYLVKLIKIKEKYFQNENLI